MAVLRLLDDAANLDDFHVVWESGRGGGTVGLERAVVSSPWLVFLPRRLKRPRVENDSRAKWLRVGLLTSLCAYSVVANCLSPTAGPDSGGLTEAACAGMSRCGRTT